MKKITIKDIRKLKDLPYPFTCITAYDFSSSKIINTLDIPIILVGDSASMVMMGYDTTTSISMEEMLVFVKSVARGSKKAHVVADMPFMSYQSSVELAIKNAGRFIKDGNAQSVKIEGGDYICEHVRSIVNFGIPVMGHVGLLPQSVNQQSGYNIQGKSIKDADKILNDALAVQDAGAFSIVLEGIPSKLAKKITNLLDIPTIGIGAGPFCDGQIQVYHDVLGLDNTFLPRHAKKYLNLTEKIESSLNKFLCEVKEKTFPSKKNFK